MNRDQLHRALLLAGGFAAYKLCILLAWNGDALGEPPWDAWQPNCFVLLFFVWGITTAGTLLVALRCIRRRAPEGRLRFIKKLVAPAFALGLVGMLLFLSLLFAGLSLPALVAVACLLSVGCALMHFGWLVAVTQTPTFPLVGALVVGQLVTSLLFLVLKLAGTEVQASFLVAACAVLFATTLALVSSLDEVRIAAAFAPRIPTTPSPFANQLVAGIAVSTLGVGILWGWSSSIRDYTLWVLGAVAVCLVFFAVSFVRKQEAKPETLIRIVFAILGIAILLTAVAPERHAVFMGVVWMGYSLLSLCLFLLGRTGADRREHADGPLLVVALALFGASASIGLAVGRVMDLAAPVIETPTAVAVALLLAFIFLFGDRAFAYAGRERNDETALTPAVPSEIDGINDAIRDQCLAFGTAQGLTEAECDTLFYLAKGFTINRIAEERVVSKNTIKSQITSIYRKVGVHSKQNLLDLLDEEPSLDKHEPAS